MKAIATPNIALIKYWGDRNGRLRLPAADSLSMTLDHPSVEVECVESDSFSLKSIKPDGSLIDLSDSQIHRIRTQLDLMNEYLKKLTINPVRHIDLIIRSHIPPGIGLASSAAVFAAIATAYAGLYKGISDYQKSVMARLGSGSASRSIFGGYAAMFSGEGDEIDAAYGEKIADEHHWMLHDVIIASELEHKKYGSTEGHALAFTSPFMKERVQRIPHRIKECTDAILKKDFEKLQHVTEEDALDMHHVMETSTPPLRYLSDETHRIMKEIESLRTSKHLEVLYTMDAGPTVHLICTDDAMKKIKEYADTQKNCTIFEAKVGPGTRLFE